VSAFAWWVEIGAAQRATDDARNRRAAREASARRLRPHKDVAAQTRWSTPAQIRGQGLANIVRQRQSIDPRFAVANLQFALAPVDILQ
ncbi:hypothetical protein, partial [Escherichia coli]|uniref:hypothetical protein n=1 Tax=Escherichia coli TaxID=562 RepID=UPI001953FBEB